MLFLTGFYISQPTVKRIFDYRAYETDAVSASDGQWDKSVSEKA